MKIWAVCLLLLPSLEAAGLPPEVLRDIHSNKALRPSGAAGLPTIRDIIATDPLFRDLWTPAMLRPYEGDLSSCQGSFTLFLPTAGVPESQGSDLLHRHLVAGALPSEAIQPGATELTSAGGGALLLVWDTELAALRVEHGAARATITLPDILACNGVIHAIDSFLLDPPDSGPIMDLTTTTEGPMYISHAPSSDATMSTTSTTTTTSTATSISIATSTTSTTTKAATTPESPESSPSPDGIPAPPADPTPEPTTTAEPPTEPTCEEVVAGRPELSTLLSSLRAAGVLDRLSAPGSFTLFAPVDDAFQALPAATMAQLVAPAGGLGAVLLARHTVPGRQLRGGDVRPGETRLATAAGGSLMVTRHPDVIQVSSDFARGHVIAFDMLCSNGIVHAINAVL